MADEPAALLAHAVDLERRDAAVAGTLETVRALAERASTVRSRAEEARTGLVRIPQELEALASRLSAAEGEVSRAQAELERAEQQLRDLEGARRRRETEIERSRREATTAREARVDAERALERLGALGAGLREEEVAYREQATEVVRLAHDVAADLARLERLGESYHADLGETLESVEEWGARVRSALFVARGTLEQERERIVVEANALGSAVLGEQLGGSSTAVIRRRVEAVLGAEGPVSD